MFAVYMYYCTVQYIHLYVQYTYINNKHGIYMEMDMKRDMNMDMYGYMDMDGDMDECMDVDGDINKDMYEDMDEDMDMEMDEDMETGKRGEWKHARAYGNMNEDMDACRNRKRGNTETLKHGDLETQGIETWRQ